MIARIASVSPPEPLVASLSRPDRRALSTTARALTTASRQICPSTGAPPQGLYCGDLTDRAAQFGDIRPVDWETGDLGPRNAAALDHI